MDQLPANLEAVLRAHATVYARRVSPHLDVDDLLQEAIIRIWRDGVTHPALVITCGKRAMVDAVRRVMGRAKTVNGQPTSRCVLNNSTTSYDAWEYPDGEPVDPFGATGRSAPSAETVALSRIEVERILDAVTGLDDRSEDLLLSLADGETLRSVGERYGVTESRMCQLRGKLEHRVRRHVEATPAERMRTVGTAA